MGVPTAFYFMSNLEFNIGGLLLMMNGIEPVVMIDQVDPEKRKMPIIYLASSNDKVIPIDYV